MTHEHGRSRRTREYDDILVPTDGSACARAGVAHGVRIARAVAATVHAVHVVDRSGRLPLLDPSRSSGERRDDRESGERVLAEAAAYGDDAGVDVVTELVEGKPAAALQEYLADSGIDLVAMGTRGRSNIERHLLGSVTQRLVRTSPVPVLTVGADGRSDGSADPTYSDVLLPTRGGDGSELAVDHAVSLAARFDATLHILYVVDIRSQAAERDTYELESLSEELHARATDEAVATATDAGVEAKAVIQQGTPHSAIQRYADDNDVDLIVMGTHGRGRVRRFLVGSITERTIRTATVPVVTVRLDEWLGADPTGNSS